MIQEVFCTVSTEAEAEAAVRRMKAVGLRLRDLNVAVHPDEVDGIAHPASQMNLSLKRGVGWVAVSSAGFGLSLICFSFSHSFWLSAGLLVPVGFFMMVQMAASNTLIQAMSPDELRGRVMAVYSMMFMGVAPFGALLAGALAERFGAPFTVAAGGVACVIGGIVFALRLPILRPQGIRMIVALQMTGGDPPEEV